MNKKELNDIFGGKVRVRVMGILERKEKVLLIKHAGLNQSNELWLPPGGGVAAGERIVDAISREFKEEVGLDVSVGAFLFAHEFINDPLHAIELFFEVKANDHDPLIGSDPELGDKQIIERVEFKSLQEICQLPIEKYHPVFQNVSSMADLRRKKGNFYLSNNP